MSTLIRPYTPADRSACLEVFDTNAPRYFSLEERPGFEAFLKLPSGVYLVLEQSGTVVGCGGYHIHPERQEAELCWGMVRQELHGMGLGKRLLLERLWQIAGRREVTWIRLDTSQHTFGFFERLGFVTQKMTPNGIWEGLDRYQMRLAVSPEAREVLCYEPAGLDKPISLLHGSPSPSNHRLTPEAM